VQQDQAEHPGRVESSLTHVRERVASEWHAASEGLVWGPRGPERFRKWLGWNLYRIATLVNPEIRDD
jgi:hypothetical protein